MNLRVVIVFLVVIFAGAALYLFVELSSTNTGSVGVSDETNTTSQFDDGMEGDGAPARDRRGREKTDDVASDRGKCREMLELYHGPELVWRKASDEVATLPEVVHPEGAHQEDMPALNLAVLAEAMEGAASVEVSSCGGWTTRYPLDRLESGRRTYYVSPNRRGGFKLFTIDDGGREETVMRRVGRISVKRNGQGNRAEELPGPE